MALIGVLALQGDFREHLSTLAAIGVDATAVKTKDEIESVDALIIPGGESTVISKLAKTFGVFDVISKRILNGLPVFGTCAGLIMLASEILDAASEQSSFGGLDVSVRRNAFGHQVDSFETDLTFIGIEGSVHAVFIRAPVVEKVSPGVEILSSLPDGRIVAVRQNNILGISFHPEMTSEVRIHQYFADIVNRHLLKSQG